MTGVTRFLWGGVFAWCARAQPFVCKESALRDVCKCEHSSMVNGWQCNGCKNTDFWGVGCDLPCPKDKCPHGCNFIGNCLIPTSKNCKHVSRHANPTSRNTKYNNDKQCQGCKDSFYGDQCEYKCVGDNNERHCKSSPAEGGCTRSGACYKCQTGWFGDNCTQACPAGCPNCAQKADTVPLPDGDGYFPAGACTEACEGNTWGSSCHNQCPSRCKAYSGRSGCTQDTGDCYKCKEKIYWGKQCEKDCAVGCKNNLCDKETGQCLKGCKQSYWGPNCDKQCSVNCETGRCSDKTGECLGRCFFGKCMQGSCKPGYWLRDCTFPCTNGTEHDCDQETGQPNACTASRFPDMAHDERLGLYRNAYRGGLYVRDGADPATANRIGILPEGSRVLVNDTQEVNGVTRLHFSRVVPGEEVERSKVESGWIAQAMQGGLNLMKAEPKYYCRPCPGSCIDNLCDVSGTCTHGCQPGTHGDQCMQNCPKNCDGRGCDVRHAGAKHEGWCMGCNAGFTGSKCESKCDPTCVTCDQHGGSGGGLLWPLSDGADHCTSCPRDEPVVDLRGHAGRCECIPGASRNATTGKCQCDPPHDDPRKQGYFQVRPQKLCRHICIKTGSVKYVEVFGDKKSQCITRAEQVAVTKNAWAGNACDPTDCKPTECKIPLASAPDGHFCLDKEYVSYISSS